MKQRVLVLAIALQASFVAVAQSTNPNNRILLNYSSLPIDCNPFFPDLNVIPPYQQPGFSRLSWLSSGLLRGYGNNKWSYRR